MRTSIKKGFTVTCAAAALLVGGATATATSANAAVAKPTKAGVTAQAAHGCPSGALCIYPGIGLNGGHPSNVYYSYGPHNLVNQFGLHTMYHNQTGGAGFKMCYGYNGTGGCSGVARAVGEYEPYNLTPINSIVLVP